MPSVPVHQSHGWGFPARQARVWPAGDVTQHATHLHHQATHHQHAAVAVRKHHMAAPAARNGAVVKVSMLPY